MHKHGWLVFAVSRQRRLLDGRSHSRVSILDEREEDARAGRHVKVGPRDTLQLGDLAGTRLGRIRSREFKHSTDNPRSRRRRFVGWLRSLRAAGRHAKVEARWCSLRDIVSARLLDHAKVEMAVLLRVPVIATLELSVFELPREPDKASVATPGCSTAAQLT